MAISFEELKNIELPDMEKVLDDFEKWIDCCIISKVKIKRRFFSRKKYAKLHLDSFRFQRSEIWKAILNVGRFERVLQKFRDKGWIVRARIDSCNALRIYFYKDLEECSAAKRIEQLKTIRARIQLMQAEICRLKTYIQEEEARLELSESPHRGLLPTAKL